MTVQQKTALAQFQESIKSPYTRKAYTENLDQFMRHMMFTDYERLLTFTVKEMQNKIIEYVLYLRDRKKVSYATISIHIAAIKHFLEMNDFIGLNWKKINKFKGEYCSVVEDRPYTRSEIGKLLTGAHSIRDKAIILLLASSGIRIGGLLKLQLKHLTPIPKYDIYQITVYKKSREQYITFCTPEAKKAIDQYMDFRRRMGEELTPNSILFRQEFERLEARAPPKPLHRSAVFYMISRLSEEIAIKERIHLTEGLLQGQPRSEIMTLHGLRKFTSTTLETEGVNSVWIDILLGHNMGLKGKYTKPTATQLLEGNGDKLHGYAYGINVLTINDEFRLKSELADRDVTINTKLAQKDREILDLRKDMEGIRKGYQQTIRLLKNPEFTAKLKKYKVNS